VHDAFIKAYRHKECFTDFHKFKSWFSTILFNTFIDRYHKKRRSADYVAKQIAVQGSPALGAASSNKGLERMKYVDLLKLMDTLSDQNREAFQLYQDGFSYKEIGKIQQIPIGTVKSRIFFVRNKMKMLINQHGLQTAA